MALKSPWMSASVCALLLSFMAGSAQAEPTPPIGSGTQKSTPSTNDFDNSGPPPSWNALFGGISGADMATADLGFSGLPRLAYHHLLNDGLSVGASFIFDYAYWAPIAAFTPAIYLIVPIRYRLIGDGALTMGLRADLGLGFIFASKFGISIPMNIGTSIGYAIGSRFIVGGGMDIPFAIVAGSNLRGGAILPLLFGPMLEVHATPQLAISLDTKFGPWIGLTGAGNAVEFGLKIQAGAAYHF